MSGITDIRKRIDDLRSAAERHRGRKTALQESLQESMQKLRDILGCEEGEEKTAIRKLKEEVEEYENQAEGLLSDAERIMRKL